MSSEAEAVLRAALALSGADRADLAATLLASLDEPEADDHKTVRGLWAQELRGRARRVLAGETPTEDWADARQRVADQLGAWSGVLRFTIGRA